MAMFFGARKPGKPELPEWRELAESLMSAVCFAQPGVSSLAEQSVNQVQLRRA